MSSGTVGVEDQWLKMYSPYLSSPFTYLSPLRLLFWIKFWYFCLHLFSFNEQHQQRNLKLCFSSSAALHHSVKLLSAFVAVPFWSCNTPWPPEAPADTVADLWLPPSPLLLQIRVPTGPRHAGQLLPSMVATGSCCLPDWGHWELGWVWEWRASWCHPYWWLRSTSTRPASTQTCWLRCSTWWSPGSSCCSTSTRSSAEVSHRNTFVTIKIEHFKILLGLSCGNIVFVVFVQHTFFSLYILLMKLLILP